MRGAITGAYHKQAKRPDVDTLVTKPRNWSRACDGAPSRPGVRMSRNLIETFDPSGAHHRELGYLAAEHLFKACPDGHASNDMIDAVQTRTEAAIRARLAPMGATIDDLRSAVHLTARSFGERYTDLFGRLTRKRGMHERTNRIQGIH
jgi:hypothetical protein